MVEAPADHLVGSGGLFGTIQEDNYQERGFVGMEKISTIGFPSESEGASPGRTVLAGESSSGRPSFR